MDLFGRDFWTGSPPGVGDPLGSLQLFLLMRSAADIPHCRSGHSLVQRSKYLSRDGGFSSSSAFSGRRGAAGPF